MSAVNLQMEQNDLIRRILDIKDAGILARIKELITQDTQIEEKDMMSKAEILAGREEAFRMAKRAKEGKITGKPIEEFLYEL